MIQDSLKFASKLKSVIKWSYKILKRRKFNIVQQVYFVARSSHRSGHRLPTGQL